MAFQKWLVSVAAPAALGAALIAAPASAETYASISVNIAPPAPQVEVAPAARPGAVWVPGHWQWRPRLNAYTWVRGRYVAVRPGYVYVPARWVQVGGTWQYRVGGWLPEAVYARGVRDIDRDGIPDRWDADRDNDGVANRYDARPNVANAPPPPPRAEVVTRRPGQVWVPGHWEWRPNAGSYTWIAGHWEARRQGQIWVPARWVQVAGGWEFRRGHWTRPGAAYRDSDGDGIADRFDRDRDNDGVANRYDRDRDNDGVPNRYDRRPDNPNR